MSWSAADARSKGEMATLCSLSSESFSGIKIQHSFHVLYARESEWDCSLSVPYSCLEWSPDLSWSFGHIPGRCGRNKPSAETEVCTLCIKGAVGQSNFGGTPKEPTKMSLKIKRHFWISAVLKEYRASLQEYQASKYFHVPLALISTLLQLHSGRNHLVTQWRRSLSSRLLS